MSSPSSNGSTSRRDEINDSSHFSSEVEIKDPNKNKEKDIRNEITEILDVDNELPVKVPIVGFETMEERAKFTVFKLRVENLENDKLDESWLVFRRYTDFVRLHSKLKDEVSNLQIPLPPKRWLRDNFETAFLEERMKGLQAFVDSILVQPHLAELPTVRRFFCLDEPPVYSDIAEESKSWYGSMEDSAIMLKHKLNEKDREIELLWAELALITIQKDNLLRMAKNCRHCGQKQSTLAASLSPGSIRNSSNPILSPSAVPSSSSSSDQGSCSPRRILPVGESHQQKLSVKHASSPISSRKSSMCEKDTLHILNGISENSPSRKEIKNEQTSVIVNHVTDNI